MATTRDWSGVDKARIVIYGHGDCAGGAGNGGGGVYKVTGTGTCGNGFCSIPGTTGATRYCDVGGGNGVKVPTATGGGCGGVWSAIVTVTGWVGDGNTDIAVGGNIVINGESYCNGAGLGGVDSVAYDKLIGNAGGDGKVGAVYYSPNGGVGVAANTNSVIGEQMICVVICVA